MDRILPGFSRWHPDARSLPAKQKSFTLRLGPDEILRLTGSCGVNRLRVHQGTVWLTGTPASGDVLLRAGDHFPLTARWPFILQALGDAEIVLC
jgi:hypothetical protein